MPGGMMDRHDNLRETSKKGTSERGCGFIACFLILGIVLTCCGLPNLLFVAQHGSWPTSRELVDDLDIGMTKQQVLDKAGPPHNIEKDERGEQWYYWTDAYGAGYFGVRFNKNGIVEVVWI